MTSKQPYRIMVVDDDADTRMLIKQILIGEYEVLMAHDGLNALEKVDRYEPDLIIMDMVMPLMDGFESCRAIHKKPRFKNLPVLFLSAHNDQGSIKKSYDSGAVLFLAKPIEPMRLLRNIALLFEENGAPPSIKRFSVRQIEASEVSRQPTPAPVPVQYPPADHHPNPNAHPEAMPGERDAPPAPGSTLVPRLLVVEDDPDLAALVTLALNKYYEVIRAADGLDAIEKLVHYQPDLMILDIMLPKMDGFELCRSIRSSKAFADIPIIVMTAKTSTKDREHALHMGANYFLAKPVNIKDLLDCCRECCRTEGFQVRAKRTSVPNLKLPDMDKRLREKNSQ